MIWLMRMSRINAKAFIQRIKNNEIKKDILPNEGESYPLERAYKSCKEVVKSEEFDSLIRQF